jgi:hypothetical protein
MRRRSGITTMPETKFEWAWNVNDCRLLARSQTLTVLSAYEAAARLPPVVRELEPLTGPGGYLEWLREAKFKMMQAGGT